MKFVTEYNDYRSFIRDYYAEKKKNSNFTWREFAESAGFSSAVHLKYVCEGKKNLSKKSAVLVADAMGLAGYDKIFFVCLVKYSLATDDASRMCVFREMHEEALVHRVKILGAAEFEYYKSWKNPVVRELATAMPEAEPAEIGKKCLPRITAAEVQDALALLLRLGLLRKDAKNRFVMADRSVTLKRTSAVSVGARDMQRQMGELALEALQKLPMSERSMMGVTFGATLEAYKRIEKEVDEFCKKVLAIATETAKTEKVFRLNVQLFPLSGRINQKN